MGNEALKASRVQRFRKRRRRIDYFPSPSAIADIELGALAAADESISAVIDRLIEAGSRAASGSTGVTPTTPAFDWGVETVLPAEHDWR
jgi:hypothetical protein